MASNCSIVNSEASYIDFSNLLLGLPHKIADPEKFSLKPIPDTNPKPSKHSIPPELCATYSAIEYYSKTRQRPRPGPGPKHDNKCVECEVNASYSLGESIKYYHYNPDGYELFCRECSWKMDFKSDKRRKGKPKSKRTKAIIASLQKKLRLEYEEIFK
jgi:hypothetical protein